MPVTVVATMQVKPESVDTVREIMKRTVGEVHQEPGCDLYSLHEADGGTFIFVEQWADGDALATHGKAPAVTQMFAEVGEHLAGAPDIKVAQAVVAGEPSKGALRP
jgi:quinol monooxygenase YgiN